MSKVKVLRLIVYEGDMLWLSDQLAKSLPDGVKKLYGGDNSIKVVTLGSLPDYVDLMNFSDSLKIRGEEGGAI